MGHLPVLWHTTLTFRKRIDIASGPVALYVSSLKTPHGLMDTLFIAKNGLGPLSAAWLVYGFELFI